jgi:hypothetical protein
LYHAARCRGRTRARPARPAKEVPVPQAAWFPLGLLAGVALLGLVMRWLVAGRARQAAARATRLTGGAVPDREGRANLVGLASRGSRQVRGAGRLVLTPDLLVFSQWMPRKDIVIPRERIAAVDTTRAHAGKATGARMLRVRFTTEDGGEDTCAWHVADLEGWLAALAGT